MIKSGRESTLCYVMCLLDEKEGYSLNKYQTYEDKTTQLIEPILEKKGFWLVDCEYVKEGADFFLRCYIDKEGGITIDDCEFVNRALCELMDEQDFIPDAYILEVSSPGLLRPLKKPKDFERNKGKDIEIKLFAAAEYEQKGKRFNAKEFVGVLTDFDETTVTITFDDVTLHVEKKNIALIRPYIEF